MVLRSMVAAQLAAISLLVGACSREPNPARAAQLTALAARIESLERRKSLIEDVNAIERLQHAYGYYVDRGLWDEVADLFADEAAVLAPLAHGLRSNFPGLVNW